MRNIQSDMINFLDEKLLSNGLFFQAQRDKNPRVIFRLAMQACVGIKEVGGNNMGPMVELIQDTIGDAGGESWCMSAIQTCLAYAEVKSGIKSPIFASEHCLTVWNETPKEQRVKNIPLPGAIVIWRHGNTTKGHTGCVEATDGKVLYTYEGNTERGINPDGSIERDGGGFYYCKRPFKSSYDMRLVGFLKPF